MTRATIPHTQNLIVRSEEFDHASWSTPSDIVVTPGTLSTGSSMTCVPATNWFASSDANWKRVAFTYKTLANGSPDFVGLRLATGDTVASYIGDGVSGMYIWGAQAVRANWGGQYQVTTAAIVNTGPIRSLP